MRSFLRRIGREAIEWYCRVRHLTAVVCGTVLLCFRPHCIGRRTVIEQAVRQIIYTAVDAVGLIILIAIIAGMSIVVQAQVILKNLGQLEMLGSVLVLIIVREIGPLLVNFIVIGRSGTAIATELASMRVRREVDLLDAQGIDPMIYLVVPRSIAVVTAVFSLTLIFAAVSLASGYIFGFLIGVTPGQPMLFINDVFSSVSGLDILNLLLKTIVPGLTTSAICCMEGLTVKGLVTEVPQAAMKGVVRSIAALLLISGIISVITYA